MAGMAATTAQGTTGPRKHAYAPRAFSDPRNDLVHHRSSARQRGFCTCHRLQHASGSLVAGDDPVNAGDPSGDAVSPCPPDVLQLAPHLALLPLLPTPVSVSAPPSASPSPSQHLIAQLASYQTPGPNSCDATGSYRKHSIGAFGVSVATVISNINVYIECSSQSIAFAESEWVVAGVGTSGYGVTPCNGYACIVNVSNIYAVGAGYILPFVEAEGTSGELLAVNIEGLEPIRF
jgi:hypothetical protein